MALQMRKRASRFRSQLLSLVVSLAFAQVTPDAFGMWSGSLAYSILDSDTPPAGTGYGSSLDVNLKVQGHALDVGYLVDATGHMTITGDAPDYGRIDQAWLEWVFTEADLRVGNQVVTWGVMEGVRIVDFINPKDYREDYLEPSKIGLPTVRGRWFTDTSDLSFYYIPCRLSSRYPDSDFPVSMFGDLPHQDPASEWDPQYALRWYRPGYPVDVGITYYSGFDTRTRFTYDSAHARLQGMAIPTRRLGIDLVGAWEQLLFKAEYVYREQDSNEFEDGSQVAVGVEYTMDSGASANTFNLFGEWYGATWKSEPIPPNLENDVFVGLRFESMGIRTHRIEAGALIDVEQSEQRAYTVKYSVNADSFSFTLSWTDVGKFYSNLNQGIDGKGGSLTSSISYSF